MHRFFLPNANFHEPIVFLRDREEIHHLKNVLRLKKGQSISVFNGKGEEALAQIHSLKAAEVQIKIKKAVASNITALPITLACAIPKKAKFESIIEKVTELGIAEIIPLRTKRAEVVYSTEKLTKKTERFRTVAINAAKQCKRTTIPVIHPVTDFRDVISNLKNHLALIPCLEGRRTPIQAALKNIKPNQSVLFLIGPEGDFTPEEVAQAKREGCIPVSLGDTVLKVDTAAISVVAFANFFLQK